MKKVHVKAGGSRDYDVTIGRGVLDRCGELLSPLLAAAKSQSLPTQMSRRFTLSD